MSAQPRPSNGDVVLACAHAFDAATEFVHWWLYPEGADFTRPDGSTSLARWLVACKRCADAVENDPRRIGVVEDGIYENGVLTIARKLPRVEPPSRAALGPCDTHRHRRRGRS